MSMYCIIVYRKIVVVTLLKSTRDDLTMFYIGSKTVKMQVFIAYSALLHLGSARHFRSHLKAVILSHDILRTKILLARCK